MGGFPTSMVTGRPFGAGLFYSNSPRVFCRVGGLSAAGCPSFTRLRSPFHLPVFAGSTAPNSLQIPKGIDMHAETAPAVPAHWLDPTFNLTELVAWSGVPYGTLYQWLQFTWAAGLDVGTKRAGRWAYSCQDLYYLALLLAISDTGVGIAPPQIHAAFDFSAKGKPDGPLILTAPNLASATLVRAPAIWQAVEDLWERCEEAGAKVVA